MTYEYALTAIRDANLDWYEHSQVGFITEMNGLKLYLTSSFLTISKNFKSITIHKPTHALWKQPTSLEQLFEEIIKQAGIKCLERYSDKYQENLKNELIKQLTGFNT